MARFGKLVYSTLPVGKGKYDDAAPDREQCKRIGAASTKLLSNTWFFQIESY